MSFDALRLEIDDHIAWITLSRPDALNALNLDAVRELYDIANRLTDDENVRAAVLTGAGDRAFCAGGDVVDFASRGVQVGTLVREITGYLHLAIARLAWMRAPVIAAVNGIAAGGGFSLAMACDLVVAADTARFTSVYTQIGFTPDGSSTYFLPRLIGRRRAMELYLTNRVLSAQEALDWGLVNRVVKAADLVSEVRMLAARLADGAAGANAGVKKLMLLADTNGLETQMEQETRFIAAASASAEGREGVRAFVEKRKAKFR
jgi:2-(1,2-epoxy-1,2-dihydrophenyl)acetyl-CoA isomerase